MLELPRGAGAVPSARLRTHALHAPWALRGGVDNGLAGGGGIMRDGADADAGGTGAQWWASLRAGGGRWWARVVGGRAAPRVAAISELAALAGAALLAAGEARSIAALGLDEFLADGDDPRRFLSPSERSRRRTTTVTRRGRTRAAPFAAVEARAARFETRPLSQRPID